MSKISAVFHTDTEMMLNTLKKRGIDVSICIICGGKIESTERPPRYLSERWAAWRNGEKFYEWNIDAFLPDGVVCNRKGCFVKSLYRDRNKSRSDIKRIRPKKGLPITVDLYKDHPSATEMVESSKKHRERST